LCLREARQTRDHGDEPDAGQRPERQMPPPAPGSCKSQTRFGPVRTRPARGIPRESCALPTA
jgi:hypothetical protein